jgi:IrrE N-terminal-like domain
MSTPSAKYGRSQTSLAEMEAIAREIQVDVWKNQDKLWRAPPVDLIDFFEPGVAVNRQGFKIENVNSIGYLVERGRRSEIAAELNNGRQLVRVATGFSMPVTRFTLGHELGHIILHPELETVHRDLPLDKAGVVRDPVEVEANRFSACYLMAKSLVINQFKVCYGTDHLKLDEDSSRLLFGVDIERAWFKYKSLRQITEFAARAGSFGQNHFRPLHSQFKVSPGAMAIRLEQLGLVSGWDI